MSETKPRRTAEEIAERRLRARRRFKAVVHLVMFNMYWLQDVSEESLGGDVKQNVAVILRRKKEKRSILSKEDKFILCKRPDMRTDEEKERINRSIGNLKCFRKYPPNVQKQLAAVTYFVYYPANRIVVKQNRPGTGLYFIISGEVSVSVTSHDPILKEERTAVVGSMVAGQMFGEISLLHDIPRTATIITIQDTELLFLMKEDFNIILKRTLQSIWDEILMALTKFTYFSFYDEVAKRECCIYSKIKTYRKGDAIYGLEQGALHDVYFVLTGTCTLVQKLMVTEVVKGGVTTYAYFDKEKFEGDIMEKARLHAQKLVVSKCNVETLKQKLNTEERESEFFEDSEVQHFKAGQKILRDQQTAEILKTYLEKLVIKYPKNVKTFFMQVCYFTELSCFGLGESLKHRVVLADSDTVRCLVIPKYWLMIRNKGNMWNEVARYLDSSIPNPTKVFKIFVENRKWMTYKRNLINSLVNKSPSNYKNNIPYSERIKNDIDFGVEYR